MNISLFWFCAISLIADAHAIAFSQFLKPLPARSHHFNILHRSIKCAVSCASMGSNVCCEANSVCALDQGGNIACCPHKSVCTGNIGLGPGSTSTAPTSASTTNAAPGAMITHAITGASSIANQYYPFPILATSFADGADCSTSYSACQAESAKCTGLIEGGGYGVTISVQNGQVTQQAAMPASSAEAICSSLSQEACHGLQLSQCATLGGNAMQASVGGSFVTESSNRASVPTACAIAYGMGFGLAIGAAGQLL